MRNLQLKPLKRLSDPQRQLLQDAEAGPLQRTRFGWRRIRGGDKTHTAHTAFSLTTRRLLVEEYGLLTITRKGRDRLATDRAAAQAEEAA